MHPVRKNAVQMLLFLACLFSTFASQKIYAQSQTQQELQNNRLGFYLALGLGGGYTGFTQTLQESPGTEKKNTVPGFALDFKTGISILDFQIFFQGFTLIFDEAQGLHDRNYLIGAGSSFYLTPDFYLTAGVGFYQSSGFYFGAGYELSRYFSLEVKGVKGKFDHEAYAGKIESDYWALILTLQFNLYISDSHILETTGKGMLR